MNLDDLNDLIAAEDTADENLKEYFTGEAGEQALVELLETGSVAVAYSERRFVIALTITEEA